MMDFQKLSTELQEGVRMCVRTISTPTIPKEKIPVFFHVPFLETGYRKINQPWKYYLISLFQKNTECLNVWSHIAGTVLMFSRLFQLSYQFDLTDRHMWPLLTGLLTFIFMFAISSVAHLFSHKSEHANRLLFMLDFSAIGLYCYGTIVSHYYYCLDKSFYGSWLQISAFPVGTIFAVFVCVCGCLSKVMFSDIFSKSRTWLVVFSIGSSYIWSNIPIFYRLLITRSLTDGLYSHMEQIACMCLVAFFFSSKIPERLSPGAFDFIGNSHQIFHIVMVICTQKHISGVLWDIHNMTNDLTTMRYLPTFWSTFGNVAIILMLDTAVICFFFFQSKKQSEKSS